MVIYEGFKNNIDNVYKTKLPLLNYRIFFKNKIDFWLLLDYCLLDTLCRKNR